jgi:ATP-binding cassette, subfamily B, bacterial HlyB/CyaB
MHHGLQLAPEELPAIAGGDMTPAVLRGMRQVGLKGRALRRCGWDQAATLGSAYPAMAVRRDGSWVILGHVMAGAGGGQFAAVLDPATEQDGVQLIPRQAFVADWDGTLVLCKRVHALGFQVLIDKVITHRSYQTLGVVLLVFVLLTLSDGVFGYARSQLMLLASNKIDARLGSRTFGHLLGLPLHFFESHPAGVLARHLQQTEKLRHFLTGRLFQTLLDAAMLPVLLVFLALYSGVLTLVVLGFSAAIAAVIAAMVPSFRHRLQLLYHSEGARQAHLVETLHNMRAVKSLVLEPARQKAWDGKLATAARHHAAVGRIGAAGTVTTNVLEKLMQVAVLGVGAMQVFDGALSIGALVAFTMLSGRVTGPLVQIVALINEYQEAALSVRMLGTVMNAAPERGSADRPARPSISGALEFDQVSFRYPGAAMPALDTVSFRVAEGQVIGVVGRSGSGKTTVTRLIQGIQTPQEGLIRLNGVDIRHIDLGHLRRGIGVVLQDNLLFRGTIRDNIAAARPDAPLEDILSAARLAGAEEVIERLPLGYDTTVEEGASNFSGGQQQRIAIARALLTRPRLLVFDEATSALDPDSEAIIQRSLAEIARDRTMIIVSHRLASLVQANAILVLERGRMVDFAPHGVLLDRCDIYRHLWQQQTQHLR